MPQRTTIPNVQAILGVNWDGQTDLQPFIDSASPLVDQVVVFGRYKHMNLTPGQQELVERWLSAHLYTQMDQMYGNKSTAGASAGFQGQTGNSLDSTNYGRTAINLDWTGCLSAISKRAFASGAWLGNKPRRGEDRPCTGTGS